MNLFKYILGITFLAALFMSIFLIPPMQKPDEPIHFLKTITITNTFQLYCQNSTKKPLLPTKLVNIAIGGQYNEGTFTREYPNPCSLPFVYYIPSSIGIYLLNMGGAPLNSFVYAGRLINGLIFFLVVVFCFSITPKHFHKVLQIFLLTPIVWLQATSLNKDWAIFTLSILLFSLYLKLISEEKNDSKLNIMLFFTYAGLVLARASYLPLAIPLLLAVLKRDYLKLIKHYAVFFTFGIIIIAAALFWGWYLPKVSHLLNQSIDASGIFPASQLASFTTQPIRFWHHLHTSVAHQIIPLYVSSIGSLGWNKTPFPDYMYIWFLIAWIWTGIELRKHTPLIKTPGLLTGITLSVLLIMASSYIFSTSVNADIIQGLQGRYFTPLFPFVLLALVRQPLTWWKHLMIIGGIMSAFSVISTVIQLY